MLGYRGYNCACIEQAVLAVSTDVKHQIKTLPQIFLKKKKKLTYSLLFQILLACKNQTGVTQNIHVTSDLLKHTQLCTTFRIVLTLQIQTESTDLTVPAS